MDDPLIIGLTKVLKNEGCSSHISIHTFQGDLKGVLETDTSISGRIFREHFYTIHLKTKTLINAIVNSGIVKRWHIKRALKNYPNALDVVFRDDDGHDDNETIGAIGAIGATSQVDFITFQKKLRKALIEDITIPRSTIDKYFKNVPFGDLQVFLNAVACKEFVKNRHIKYALGGHKDAIATVFSDSRFNNSDDADFIVWGYLKRVIVAQSTGS